MGVALGLGLTLAAAQVLPTAETARFSRRSVEAPDYPLWASMPPRYVICMATTAGSNLAARGDGRLCINNLGEQWRETDGNGVFNRGVGAGLDCAFNDASCTNLPR